jgi:hypothetical protein
MKVLVFFISSLFFCPLLFGQTDLMQGHTMDTTAAEKEGILLLTGLNINQDQRLEKMLHWHIENNKRKDGMEGFRVEVFSSSALNAKERSFREKVEFLKLFPDYKVHVVFSAPVFKVRTGDFRTKNEALKLLKEIQSHYPGAFIVPDIVDFPSLKSEDYERTN